jgi:glutathione peroxidase
MLNTIKALAGIATGIGGVKTEGEGVNIHGFSVEDMNGELAPLSDYAGKVVLLVNTASQCGCTPQYEDLVALQERYGSRGFSVLAFPCNDFGHQEPGTNEEITEFCRSRYAVNFPVFGKVHVKGVKSCHLWAALTSRENGPFAGEIGWNFTKFLADRGGTIRARLEPQVNPQSPEVTGKIEALLET